MKVAFETKEAAEAASNAMFLLKNPEGTTELLYGFMLEDGQYVLQGVDECFVCTDGVWSWVERGAVQEPAPGEPVADPEEV